MAASHRLGRGEISWYGWYLQRLPFSRYNLQRGTDLLYAWVARFRCKLTRTDNFRPGFNPSTATPKAFVYLVNRVSTVPPLSGLPPLRNNLGEQSAVARAYSTRISSRLGYDLRERHAGILLDLCYRQFRNLVGEMLLGELDKIK